MKEPQTKRNTQAVGCIKPLSFTSVRVRGFRSGRGGSGKGGPVADEESKWLVVWEPGLRQRRRRGRPRAVGRGPPVRRRRSRWQGAICGGGGRRAAAIASGSATRHGCVERRRVGHGHRARRRAAAGRVEAQRPEQGWELQLGQVTEVDRRWCWRPVTARRREPRRWPGRLRRRTHELAPSSVP